MFNYYTYTEQAKYKLHPTLATCKNQNSGLGIGNSAVMRALPSHQCSLGLILMAQCHTVCGLGLFLFLPCSKLGFFSKYSGSSTPEKPSFLNSNLVRTSLKTGWVWCGFFFKYYYNNLFFFSSPFSKVNPCQTNCRTKTVFSWLLRPIHWKCVNFI